MLPLITDDTGTQGKGKFQLEFSPELDHEDSKGIEQTIRQLQTTVSYGLVDTMDLIVNLPFQFITTKQSGVETKVDGISDVSVQFKWRFLERGGFSLALKPGASFPSGDAGKGLGAGKSGGSFYLIATQKIPPWAFHWNAGYGRNETTTEEETDIWYFSLATEFEAFKWLKLVANVGAERNHDKLEDTPAAFILGGLVFPVTKNLDLSFGVKGGLPSRQSTIACFPVLRSGFKNSDGIALRAQPIAGDTSTACTNEMQPSRMSFAISAATLMLLRAEAMTAKSLLGTCALTT